MSKGEFILDDLYQSFEWRIVLQAAMTMKSVPFLSYLNDYSTH